MCGQANASQSQADDRTLRIVSWNIAGDAFVTHEEFFLAIIRHSRPDVLVLTEVHPSADAAQLKETLAGIDSRDDRPWNVNFGTSGGRQRDVIASRMPIERTEEFSSIVPYPEKQRQRISTQMTGHNRSWDQFSMAGGIPVNGAIVVADGHRLLVVATDLQCCGGEINDWQEDRRQVEAREIRRLTNQALSKSRADAVIIAGDLNTVATPSPVLLLLGPYMVPHHGLLAAEIFHLDGESAWTWDGRGTPFQSSILDYQLYGPNGLQLHEAYIFDTEDLDADTLGALGLQADTSRQISPHRPLVVDYSWR